MSKKQTNINILVNILAFGVQFLIGFYTAPVMINALGTEAYGFIGLSTDFVNYLSIITAVFNSVAARFISYEIAKNNIKKAEGYFNSLLAVNCCLSVGFAIFALMVIPNIDLIFEVPNYILSDVKWTFIFTFATYIIGVMTSIFTTSTFVKNRLDIQGGRNIIQYIIRFVGILFFLNVVEIHIYWIAVASFIAAVVIAILNIRITKKIMPEVKIDLRKASWVDVKVLAASGAWLAITNLSSILIRGLDLVVANLTLGSYDMGLLSVARIFPNHFSSIVVTIAPIFTPVFVSMYAKKEIGMLIESTVDSIKKMGLIMIVPVTGFIVFSNEFYALWQKSYTLEEIRIISVLSTITVVQCYFNSATATMAQMSVVVNKLKLPVIVTFICGIVNLGVVFCLLNYTSLGVFAIVLSSTVIMTIRYIVFNSFYCAYVLKCKPWKFILAEFQVWITIPVQGVIMYLVKKSITIDSWLTLIIAVLLGASIGYVVQFILVERKNAILLIRKVLHR